jgi:hypothetical protein
LSASIFLLYLSGQRALYRKLVKNARARCRNTEHPADRPSAGKAHQGKSAAKKVSNDKVLIHRRGARHGHRSRATISDFFSPKNLDMRTATQLMKELEGE